MVNGTAICGRGDATMVKATETEPLQAPAPAVPEQPKAKKRRKARIPADQSGELVEAGDVEGLIDHFSSQNVDLIPCGDKLKEVKRAIDVRGKDGPHGLAAYSLNMLLRFNLEQWARAMFSFRRHVKAGDDRYVDAEIPEKAIKEDVPRLERIQENLLKLIWTAGTFEHLADVKARHSQSNAGQNAPPMEPPATPAKPEEFGDEGERRPMVLPKRGCRAYLRSQGWEELPDGKWARFKKLAPDCLEYESIGFPDGLPPE